MDEVALMDELAADPEGLGYGQHLPHAPGQIARLLNEPTRRMVKSRWITARTAMAELGLDGARIMEKIEQFGASEPNEDEFVDQLRIAAKWAMRFVSADGEGLDIGHATSQTLLGALGSIGVLEEGEVEAVRLMAVQPASRAEELFGEGALVTESQIRQALAAAGVVG